MWRRVNSVYERIGEAQLQSANQVTTGSRNFRVANIILTGNNRIQFRSGDVVGYYHPFQSRYQLRDMSSSNKYVIHRFDGSLPNRVRLRNSNAKLEGRRPLLQFTIGKKCYNSMI